MNATQLITLIISISGIAISFFITIIIKSVGTITNRALENASKIVTKQEFLAFKQELREEMANEAIKQNEKNIQTIAFLFDKKIQEIANIGTKISSLDGIADNLKRIKQEFIDEMSKIPNIENKIEVMESRFNSFIYGTSDKDKVDAATRRTAK